MRSPSRHKSSFRAVTLVELLAIVALVAVLVALIFPAVEMARAASQKMKCSSNLRAIGQTALLYAAENNNNLLPYRMDAPVGDPAGFWYDHLYEYVGRARGQSGRYVNGIQKEYPGFICPLTPNGKYAINRLCGWKGHSVEVFGEPQAYLKLGQVFVNAKVVQPPGGLAKTAWFACPVKGNTTSAFLPENYRKTDFIGFPHSDSANVLFMDGHVENIRNPDFPNHPSLLQEEHWIHFFGKRP